jgi:hypothetical protein
MLSIVFTSQLCCAFGFPVTFLQRALVSIFKKNGSNVFDFLMYFLTPRYNVLQNLLEAQLVKIFLSFLTQTSPLTRIIASSFFHYTLDIVKKNKVMRLSRQPSLSITIVQITSNLIMRNISATWVEVMGD